MKKLISFLLIFVILFLSSCDVFDGKMRRHMVEYYSNDEHYAELSGTVASIHEDPYLEELKLYISGLQVLTEIHDFPVYKTTDQEIFTIVNYKDLSFNINVGDEIVFTSAPGSFYNGHNKPIVELKRGGDVLLTFEDGKAAYLDWIVNVLTGD